MHTRNVLVLALSASLSILAQTGPTGSIAGVVVGDDGKFLSAIVIANKFGGPMASGHTDSAADGTFTIKNLPAGTYHLCARTKAPGYLDPCVWSPTPIAITFAAGQAVTGYRLVIKKGAVVQVRINDAADLLEAPAAAGKAKPYVRLGIVTARRVYEPVPLAGKDGRSRIHQITVPLNDSSTLHIRGSGVQISDSAGKAVDQSGSTVIVKPAGVASPPPIVLNIGKP